MLKCLLSRPLQKSMSPLIIELVLTCNYKSTLFLLNHECLVGWFVFGCVVFSFTLGRKLGISDRLDQVVRKNDQKMVLCKRVGWKFLGRWELVGGIG